VHLSYLFNLTDLWIIAPGILTAIVLAVWSTKFMNPKIRGAALTGTAQVLSVNRATSPYQPGDALALRIGLRVEVPGRQPYDVTVKRTVDLSHVVVGHLKTGATFPVQVDATDPQKVRFDFSQPIT
jgi:hypothetical protein